MATTKQTEAVKKTIIMWEWLRDNAPKDKHDYGQVNFEILGVYNRCYLCEAVGHNDYMEPLCCDKTTWCPLDTIELSCDGDGSSPPYDKWEIAARDNDKTEAEEQAQRIIDACKNWLEENNEVGI